MLFLQTSKLLSSSLRQERRRRPPWTICSILLGFYIQFLYQYGLYAPPFPLAPLYEALLIFSVHAPQATGPTDTQLILR